MSSATSPSPTSRAASRAWTRRGAGSSSGSPPAAERRDGPAPPRRDGPVPPGRVPVVVAWWPPMIDDPSAHSDRRSIVIKRLALAGATATLALGFATTAMASGPSVGHRAVKPRHSVPAVRQGGPLEPGASAGLVAPGAQPASIHPTRTMAITQIAVYDAVNGIWAAAARSSSTSAARAERLARRRRGGAARTALDALLPSQRRRSTPFFATSVAQLRAGPCGAESRFGERVAHAVLAGRAHDGAAVTPPVFTPSAGPGSTSWHPPAFAPGRFHPDRACRAVRAPSPRASSAPARRRRSPAPGTPPTSGRSTRSGELNSMTRTADETAIGDLLGRRAPVWVVWNQIADQAAAGFGSTVERERPAVRAARHHARRQRDRPLRRQVHLPPLAADHGDHGAPTRATRTPRPTRPGSRWPTRPTTPAIPGRTPSSARPRRRCSRTASSGGCAFSFSLTNATVGITRTFGSFSQAAAEASASRIFAGQHFGYDEDAGQRLGAHVAGFVLDRVLRHPAHR